MTCCPKCGSSDLPRSRVRWWERPLRHVTPRRPHRCAECAWRGWIVRDSPPIRPEDILLPAAPDISIEADDLEPLSDRES